MRAGIAAAGNWIVDRVKMIDAYPDQDNLANIDEVSMSNGGGPFNALVDLSRLGAEFPLEACGLIGEDDDGRWIRAVLAEHRIIDHLGHALGAPTSFTDVMCVRSTGRRTFFHARGANALFGPTSIDPSRLGAAHIHLGYLLLLDEMDAEDAEFGTGAGRALAACRSAGMTTSLDVVSEQSDRFASVVRPTLPHADIAFMNEYELGKTVGEALDPDDADGIADALGQIVAMGCRQLAVAHTEKLMAARSADGEVWIQPAARIPQAEIAGALGAGDAFAAGFLLAWMEGAAPGECLKMGAAAGAACLTHPSASLGVRKADECRALLERWS